jgi:hypothetical protein
VVATAARTRSPTPEMSEMNQLVTSTTTAESSRMDSILADSSTDEPKVRSTAFCAAPPSVASKRWGRCTRKTCSP